MDYSLFAISPVDGRYRKATEKLAVYFSEAAIIQYRVIVEIEYFIALCKLPLPELREIDKKVYSKLRHIGRHLNDSDVMRVKDIEKETNHDVKAIEYFLKEKFKELGLSEYSEFVHFGLTSQDVNNTAFPMATRDAFVEVYLPLLEEVFNILYARSQEWKDVAMMAHTHGQPASPTTVGKELFVFTERLGVQIAMLESLRFEGKFGGATGNFNAHHVAYPDIDWNDFADNLLEKSFGLSRQKTTTQIEHYDNLAALFDNLKRINTILIDLDRDIWAYISMEYFRQKVKKGETGSSTMPHKVNPIDFENSEGNLGLANTFYEYLSAKLPISRLQRDLTDSTVIRNIGMPFAHSVIGFKSLLKGLDKLILNEAKLQLDLNNNWAVVSEALQTILRREKYPNPYEALKDLTRGNRQVTRVILHEFIDSLKVSRKVKNELKKISPENYTGIISF
ncbi:MAG: adenylosuccinate lyase [Bacteroidetes bacterium]|nr:adenylosuccinate lyase [Bacteroidota bacterium]